MKKKQKIVIVMYKCNYLFAQTFHTCYKLYQKVQVAFIFVSLFPPLQLPSMATVIVQQVVEEEKTKKLQSFTLKKKAYFCTKKSHFPSLGLTFLNLSFHTFQVFFFQLFSQIHFGETTKKKEKIQEVSHPSYQYEYSSTLSWFPHLVFSMSTHQLTF